jgi:hypothetical protein
MGLIFTHALIANRAIFIPLTDASQGGIGLLISDRPGCIGPLAPWPAALQDCAGQNLSLMRRNINKSSSRNLHTDCSPHCDAE